MTNKSFKCETPDSLPKCISEAIAMRKLLRPLPFRYVHLVLSYYRTIRIKYSIRKDKDKCNYHSRPCPNNCRFSTENCKRKTIISANGNNISAYCMTAKPNRTYRSQKWQNLNTCTRMYAYEINATMKA